jgi:hypothetical protein
MRWLDTLLGRGNPYSLPDPRREPLEDDTLRLPADPTIAAQVEGLAGRTCPARRGRGKARRACGLPKAPGHPTCGRPRCRAWARRQPKPVSTPRAKVLAMGRRG